VNKVMNQWITHNAWNFVTRWETISSSRNTLPHGIRILHCEIQDSWGKLGLFAKLTCTGQPGVTPKASTFWLRSTGVPSICTPSMQPSNPTLVTGLNGCCPG
jgi:hypothetical protein